MHHLHHPKKTVFSNGLTLITVPMKDSPTVTVEVLVEAGSEYETAAQSGLSHFLEHMCFKGTDRRPSAAAVSRELDEMGAQYNAFTGHELTGYYAKGRPEHAERLLDIVSDIYMNAIFKKEDIERERGVIIEEINMYEDQPSSIAGELFDKVAHGDQPAGRPIAGTKETVSAFAAEDFIAYRKAHYVAKATIVSIAGAFDEKKMIAAAEKAFAGLSYAKKIPLPKTKTAKGAPLIGVRAKDTDQAHFVFGVRSYPIGNKKNAALSALSSVLSAGMSSRLFLKMREELGICYYVRAGNSPSLTHGEFGVSAGVNPARLPEAVAAIGTELRRLAREPVSAEELAKSVEIRAAGMYMGLETSDAVAEYYAHRYLFHRDLQGPAEREAAMRAVTPADIMRAAKAVFDPDNVIFSLVTRAADEKEAARMLKAGTADW